MFNLLVSYVGWKPPSSSMGLDRFLEHSDDGLFDRFRPNGKPDLDGLTRLPALFMTEKGGSGPQEARVGIITRAVLKGKIIEFDFQFSDFPPLPLQAIEALASELHIDLDSWELSRGHWGVKNADLFAALYRHALRDAPRPRIFGVDRVLPVDADQVSVMIRFRSDFDQVFEAVKDAAESEGFKCHRVRDIWERDAIIADIANLIMRSRVVVADLTDRNANVFYECGFAHGVGREVVPITQDKADNFDVQHLRHILYHNTQAGRDELSRQLTARFKAIRGES